MRYSLAEDEGGCLLGFQSLIRVTEGNRYGTPIGWGIIGTHVSPDAARLGVGRRLNFTRQAAIDTGVTKIEAFIGLDNAAAQAFYESVGFRTYRQTHSAVCKCWSLDGDPP
ncbi:GNAT family N-acetyltransferase [Rhizobium leguminosarum]|uniref:GNAT family N-acetyltransferase n=1 Tax=Rhizobium leguminosarum TaxID=384 RepID=UPI000CF50138